MLRPGKSSNGLPNHSGGSYSGGGYSNPGYGYNGYENNQGYGGYSSGYQQQNTQYDVYAQPQQPAHSPRRSPPESPFMKLLKNKWIWTLLVCFLLLLTTLHYRSQHKATLAQLKVTSVEEAVQQFQDAERERSRWRKDNHVHMHAQEEYKKKIDGLKQANTRLEIEKSDFEQKYNENKVSLKRQDAMEHQIELLQNATSRESRRAVLEKYGQGPHQVEIAIKAPNSKLEVIVVEMAPLDLVPHAIHLFLEQVSHRLWDGTYLYLNGPHVMQSGPQDFQNKATSKLQKFVDAGLDKLAFPEYSPDFPHLPFVSIYVCVLLCCVFLQWRIHEAFAFDTSLTHGFIHHFLDSWLYRKTWWPRLLYQQGRQYSSSWSRWPIAIWSERSSGFMLWHCRGRTFHNKEAPTA